jgi:short subunit dehydrogenase-like uncharacterized protein
MAVGGTWMIYGANGYTGRLVALEAKRQGLRPVLAGRRADAIAVLATELDLPSRVFDLADGPSALAALAGVAVVAHCAGPFSTTSPPMIAACLQSRTHYLDITGEIDVLAAAERHDAAAHAAGIVMCPGVGFDVVPTDCIAAVLKEALPDATHLVLAFDAMTTLSPGTAKTIAESFKLTGKRGGRVRRDGKIVPVPLGHQRRRIPFDGGSAMTLAVAWGDVATAYFSTGIPNIETYVAVPATFAMLLPLLNWLQPLLASQPVQAWLRNAANRQKGPSEERLHKDRARLWGEVRNAAGQIRTARLTTPNGYLLTAHGTVMAAKFLLEHMPAGGYYTPAQLMGARCVEQLPGVDRIRVV